MKLNGIDITEKHSDIVNDVAKELANALHDQNVHLDIAAMMWTCISIGVEIAMQHRHQQEYQQREPYSGPKVGGYHTGPAEAIDHEW